MKATEVTRILRTQGAIMLRQRGSHQRWALTQGERTYHTTVPMHRGDIPPGTLHAIEKHLEPALGKGWLHQ